VGASGTAATAALTASYALAGVSISGTGATFSPAGSGALAASAGSGTTALADPSSSTAALSVAAASGTAASSSLTSLNSGSMTAFGSSGTSAAADPGASVGALSATAASGSAAAAFASLPFSAPALDPLPIPRNTDWQSVSKQEREKLKRIEKKLRRLREQLSEELSEASIAIDKHVPLGREQPKRVERIERSIAELVRALSSMDSERIEEEELLVLALDAEIKAKEFLQFITHIRKLH
jgi:hypothetical protein